MKPTVGRIVHVFVRSSDRPYAGIVTHVHRDKDNGDYVDVVAFDVTAFAEAPNARQFKQSKAQHGPHTKGFFSIPWCHDADRIPYPPDVYWNWP